MNMEAPNNAEHALAEEFSFSRETMQEQPGTKRQQAGRRGRHVPIGSGSSSRRHENANDTAVFSASRVECPCVLPKAGSRLITYSPSLLSHRQQPETRAGTEGNCPPDASCNHPAAPHASQNLQRQQCYRQQQARGQCSQRAASSEAGTMFKEEVPPKNVIEEMLREGPT